MTTYRVAVVGLGVGRQHVAAWQALGDRFRVVLACDLDPARAEAVAAELGIPAASSEFARALGTDIDIVDIATPPMTHLALAEAALAAGKHVVVEKPLVGSLADADRLADAAARARGVLMPIFQYRFGDGLEKLRRIRAAGIGGRLHLTTVETAWRRLPEYYAVPWRGRWATELGGCLTAHAIHAHDILTHIAGPVRSVFARAVTRVNRVETEDCAVAALEMADGSLASLGVTLGSAHEITRLRFSFDGFSAESSLGPYDPAADPWRFTPLTPEIGAAIDAVVAACPPGESRFAGQFAAFHAALESGAPPPVTLDDARRSLELLSALYWSARSGLPVALPLGAEHPIYRGWRPAA